MQPQAIQNITNLLALSELKTFPNQAVIWDLMANSYKRQIWEWGNKASLNTAFKIGFRVESYYIQLVPGVGNVEGPKLQKWLKNKEAVT